ncbi:ATP-dependent Clp protease proteolytic subunit [Zunongwangia sp. SCSIO 43204]|uniref:ATP-dependent Clp protease proteolytic subunit n=1 Tax=Zunongwangia sp. SCSIO 43204 TaxID=2779359 RepID=UPI001CA9EBC3|nr:ATP-dependent Clp protease proteolytic subunit [Zunongwangia sp. SCSIO 43204]UAB85687.1 ATP-dependent Clp protease proteolytic subunit [Zunongwangia sp. SCSIO 43204]
MKGIIKIRGVIGKIPDENGEIITPNTTFLNVSEQAEAQKQATEFDMIINSPGGYMEDGDEMFDYLDGIQKNGKPFTTIAEEECASMATKLFLLGERRIIKTGTIFMIHNPGGAPEHGDADYIEAYYKGLRSLETNLINFYHERTGTSKEALKTLMKNETELTPEQAVAFGFATEIYKPELKAVAFSKKFNPNSFKMSDKTKDKKNEETLGKLDQLLDLATNFFKKSEKPKGLKMQLDGTGEKEIIFPDLEPDDTPSVEDKATIDGSPAEGDIVMPSGETFKFEGGILKEIVPKEEEGDDDIEALKQERDDLKSQLEAQNKKTEKAEKEVTALKKKVGDQEKGFEKITKEITALKSQITSDFSHDPKKKNYKEREEGTRQLWKKKDE